MSALAELAWEVSSETREYHAVEIHTLAEEGTSTLRSASLRAPHLFEPPYTDPYVRRRGSRVAALPRHPLSRLGSSRRAAPAHRGDAAAAVAAAPRRPARAARPLP